MLWACHFQQGYRKLGESKGTKLSWRKEELKIESYNSINNDKHNFTLCKSNTLPAIAIQVNCLLSFSLSHASLQLGRASLAN